MNEFEAIEQDLSRLADAKPPASLRADVLAAIQSQREADAEGIVLTPRLKERVWLKRLERTAAFAAPGVLALSLLIFAIVDQSAGGLYRGHSRSVISTQSLVTKSDARPNPNRNKPSESPRAFFQQHFAILQRLNSELFCGTSQKIPQAGGDRQPLGFFRPRADFRVLQLASLASSRGEIGSAA